MQFLSRGSIGKMGQSCLGTVGFWKIIEETKTSTNQAKGIEHIAWILLGFFHCKKMDKLGKLACDRIAIV
jgi:hypothetical protein